MTRFFNSQPKTLTEKEASAFIERSSLYNEDYKNVSQSQQQILGCDSSSGQSRIVRSGSPPFDNSNTATTSESGNGGSNSRTQNKATGSKETNENNSAGDSGENVYSGGTGTGTSGGVSAVANAHHKRIHNRTYGKSKNFVKFSKNFVKFH